MLRTFVEGPYPTFAPYLLDARWQDSSFLLADIESLHASLDCIERILFDG